MAVLVERQSARMSKKLKMVRPGPYLSNPPFYIFWHSGTLTLSAERQSARMSKIKNGGLDQYGPPEHCEV